MSNDIRRVRTPRVKKSSKRYRADIARMKLFYDYEDYLAYEEEVVIWCNIQDAILSVEDDPYEDCSSNNISHSHLMRRRTTARCHRRFVDNSEILMHKADKEPQMRKETGYRRVRILQPQCAMLEDIRLDGYNNIEELAASFDSYFESRMYLVNRDFPTYDEYLDYLTEIFISEEFCTSLKFDVSALRIAQRSPKNLQFTSFKAKAYKKRADCLYGKKKKASQKLSSANKSNGSAKSENKDNEPVPERRSIYSNRKFSVLHAVSPHTDSVKESRVEISVVSCSIVPRFF